MATSDVVPAGEGDGQLRETVRALAADRFDGFFSMEPHLGSAHHLGGFSGPENFIRATEAFTGILQGEQVDDGWTSHAQRPKSRASRDPPPTERASGVQLQRCCRGTPANT